MLRRSILELASRSSVNRVRLGATNQVPYYLSSRRTFAVSGENGPHKPDSVSGTTESKSRIPKVIGAALILGPIVFGAYYYGVLDRYIGKEQKIIHENTKAHGYTVPQIDDKRTLESPEENAYKQSNEVSESDASSNPQEPNILRSSGDHVEKGESPSAQNLQEDSIRSEGDSYTLVKDAGDVTPDTFNHLLDKDTQEVPTSSTESVDITSKLVEESADLKSPEVNSVEERGEAIGNRHTFPPADKSPVEIDVKSLDIEPTPDEQEVVQSDGTENSSSLLDDYCLGYNNEESSEASSSKHKDVISTIEDAYDGYISRDGKLVLDFLNAIHAAEERQAAMDARFFAEEKRAMKEKYEKELKDARAREVMYAEREAILGKELNKERVKAAASLKSLQEKLEEKLRSELDEKERETEQKLKEMRDIAKAELAAAIASEKASQIEKMVEANLHINALCMAFYARSEEARQTHSVHKLALGALALEYALSKGQPIQKEVEALHSHLEGMDSDPLISLVLSSLPDDTQKHGSDTLPQLNHKFDAMKGMLRHFSLIPPGGGGILTHSLAYVASWLKVKGADQSGDGIESLINRVEHLLAQGKISEAADVLENGVKGSQAAEVVDDWVRRARNRAITEQALTVLQSYATSISLT